MVGSFPKTLNRWCQPQNENATAVADLRLLPVTEGFAFGTVLDVFNLLEGVLLHSFPRSRSPNGRYLALLGSTVVSNVWLLENFKKQ